MSETSYARQQRFDEHPVWQGKRPLLPHLDVELTERCNNNCTHCYINLPLHDANAQARELSTAQWQAIFRQAADLGALSLRMTGGEVLVREDFTELYLTARRLGMRVQVLTNGRLITPELTELWTRVAPLMPIEVTVYGMTAATYDVTARCPGAYEEFRRGVARLEERQIPFTVKATVLPTNKDDVADFEAWSAAIPWMTEPPSYAVCLNLRVRHDSEAKNRAIRAQRLAPADVVAFVNRRAGYRSDMAQFTEKFTPPADDRLFTCGAGHQWCVDAYGRLLPCMLLRSPEMTADLLQTTLRDGIADVRERLAGTRASDPRYLQRCARCILRSLCEQCPARAWIEHGALDTPVDYHCRVAHARARDLGLLGDGEYGWEVNEQVHVIR